VFDLGPNSAILPPGSGAFWKMLNPKFSTRLVRTDAAIISVYVFRLHKRVVDKL
jgi:hypothetical protein